MQPSSDTIFALATAVPPVQGSGIAIIRLSGPDAFKLASEIISSDADSFPHKEFNLATISHDGKEIDRAGILSFRGPHSYTGENVVEFHIHGGLEIIRSVERALVKIGARPAEPGEFTRRAFLNGRLDLLQAEAIASLVSAAGEAARREALRQRAGRLSGKIESVRSALRDILARLEVDFDYPEERIDGMESDEAVEKLGKVASELKPLLESWEKGNLLGGFRLAIVGLPNVGKSSLLNALTGEDTAIVTSTPGTTRDVVSGRLTFGGVPAELLDTAGIRIIDENLDTAEAEGIRRSWREVERAHLVLMVFDTNIPLGDDNIRLVKRARSISEKTGAAILLVCNKSDLFSAWEPNVVCVMVEAPDSPHVIVSAKTGDGLDKLRAKVRELLRLDVSPDEILLTDSRHHALIEEVYGIIERVRDDLAKDLPQDVAATELWGADRALGRLLGEDLVSADLDEIFSRFCIGK